MMPSGHTLLILAVPPIILATALFLRMQFSAAGTRATLFSAAGLFALGLVLLGLVLLSLAVALSPSVPTPSAPSLPHRR